MSGPPTHGGPRGRFALTGPSATPFLPRPPLAGAAAVFRRVGCLHGNLISASARLMLPRLAVPPVDPQSETNSRRQASQHAPRNVRSRQVPASSWSGPHSGRRLVLRARQSGTAGLPNPCPPQPAPWDLTPGQAAAAGLILLPFCHPHWHVEKSNPVSSRTSSGCASGARARSVRPERLPQLGGGSPERQRQQDLSPRVPPEDLVSVPQALQTVPQ